MPVKTWFATNAQVSNFVEMSETSPGSDATASPQTGWVVGTGFVNHSELDSGSSRASTSFLTTLPPDGSLDSTLGDALRSSSPLLGSFEAGNWTVNFTVIGVTQSGAHDGNMRCRVLRSANADGSGATEITSAQQVGSTVTNLGATQQTSTVTFALPAFSVNNEYIFVQIAWQRTGAGGMTTTDVAMRIGTTATRVISTNFTPPPTLDTVLMTDADRSYVETRTDLTLNFDRTMELGGANYTLGDTVAGLTISINGGAASPVTYVSGEGTNQWKVRHPDYLSILDTVTISYSQASGNIVSTAAGSVGDELSAVSAKAVTNNLTKRIILFLKDKNNAAITTQVGVGVWHADSRDIDNANWGVKEMSLKATPDGTGRLNFEYTGAVLPGGSVYVAVFSPAEDASAPTAATESYIWVSTVE